VRPKEFTRNCLTSVKPGHDSAESVRVFWFTAQNKNSRQYLPLPFELVQNRLSRNCELLREAAVSHYVRSGTTGQRSIIFAANCLAARRRSTAERSVIRAEPGLGAADPDSSYFAISRQLFDNCRVCQACGLFPGTPDPTPIWEGSANPAAIAVSSKCAGRAEITQGDDIGLGIDYNLRTKRLAVDLRRIGRIRSMTMPN
jgi:hypothetical protein